MKSLKINSRNFFIYENDLPENINLGQEISIDTETTGLSLVRDRLCLMQISSESGDCHIIKFDIDYFEKMEKPKKIISILKDSNVTKIFHFARFDLAMIKKFLNISCDNIFCTKIASKLVRTYTDRHGLKDLCRELLQIDINKSQQSSDWSLKELSDSQIKYAASDVIYLIKLKEKLTTMLVREKRLDLAFKIFKFLNTRVDLDIMGYNDQDIFSHS